MIAAVAPTRIAALVITMFTNVACDGNLYLFVVRLLHAYRYLHLPVNDVRLPHATFVADLDRRFTMFSAALFARKILYLVLAVLTVHPTATVAGAETVLLPLLGFEAMGDVRGFARGYATATGNLFMDILRTPLVPGLGDGPGLVAHLHLEELLFSLDAFPHGDSLDTMLVRALVA